ncbi:MAG: hypothetical protein INR64_12130 [Caulobacteraceae bacterium]|nr:hypothetical protein [Caulobacter sp.]
MCFSAPADFAAAAAVGAVGVATLMQVHRPRAALFAALPLLFAAHQATEGVVWLGADRLVSPAVTRAAMLAFMLYAQALLPLLVAAGVWLIEPSPARRRWVALTVACAAGLCVLGAWGLASTHSIVTVQGRCLAFRNPVTNHPWYALAYALPAAAPLLSSRPWVRAFGALNLAGMAVVLLVRAYALTSVWCLYAAALSVMLYWAVRREEAAPSASTLTFPQPRTI